MIPAVVGIQFFHVLFTGDTNGQLKRFGHSLAIYSFEAVDYLTFNTEIKPFPLDAAWPEDLSERGASETTEETEYELALARRQAIRVLLDNLESSERKGTLSHETFDTLHRQLLARREANDKRIAHMLEHTPALNTIELQIESTHLSALEKQVYRDLEKAGDLDYDSMEALVREVVDRNE
mgnify:CR=1 FL=1